MEPNENLLNLLEELGNLNIDGDRYSWNGVNVPRTNDILSAMIHEEYLMTWAWKMGKANKNFEEIRAIAAEKGSIVHDSIEKFLTLSQEPVFDFLSDKNYIIRDVTNAYNSFKFWYNTIINNGGYISCLAAELKLVCPWYGGTADAIFNINGKVYLFDFKTSNQPSFRYFIQLAAYYYILTTYMNYKIDGVCILMLNKYKVQYQELILDFSISQQADYFNQCINTFFSLLYAYYNRCFSEQMYIDIFGNVFESKSSNDGFFTKVVGVTQDNRQTLIQLCNVGDELSLIREPQNKFDTNAIQVCSDKGILGYLSADLAAKLASQMDNGKTLKCYVSSITGGQSGKNYGININIKFI